MRAYTGEGAHLADHATLVALAADAGFPAKDAQALLQGDDHADAVRADHYQARRHGVTGVPSFILAGRRRIAGAQPMQVLGQELHRAWRVTTR